MQGKEPTNYNESALARLGMDEEGGDKKPRLIRGEGRGWSWGWRVRASGMGRGEL